MSYIPMIDFSHYQQGDGIEHGKHGEVLEKLGEELKSAFETVGFCYIKNHGIDSTSIERHFNVSRMFFTRPLEEKQKYSRDGSNFGWVPLETERVVQNRPAGYRESFNYYGQADRGYWGPEALDFYESTKLMVQHCSQLALRILRALSVGLGLEADFIEKAHSRIGLNDNYSCFKSLYYPPISNDGLIKPNQIRIGEHSDFGSLTILFQDDQGGLEVEVPGQGFVPAAPIPGTVVVNIGDLMQRWTADKLVATKHRVIIPEAGITRRSSRQSFACFIHPDNDVIIKCLDGSGKYEDINAVDYVTYRLDDIYNTFLSEKDN